MEASKQHRTGPFSRQESGRSANAGGTLSAVGRLIERADALHLRAPELTLVLGERAAALAEAAGADEQWIRAESLVVSARVRLGMRPATVGRAVAALRAAEHAGYGDIAARLRIDLAVCARSIGVPLTGLAALRPVLTDPVVSPVHRAAALCHLVGCLAQLARKAELDRVLAEADKLVLGDESLDADTQLLVRALLRVGTAAHRRRHGDLTAAADAARTGLGFLEKLDNPADDGGLVRIRLVLQLVSTLLDRGDPEMAYEFAEPMLAEPVRAAGVAPMGWLRLAVATRIHLPAGAGEAAIELVREAVASADRHGLSALTARLWLELAQLEERFGRPEEAIACLYRSRAAEQLHGRARRQACNVLAGEFGAGEPASVDLDEVLKAVPSRPVPVAAEPEPVAPLASPIQGPKTPAWSFGDREERPSVPAWSFEQPMEKTTVLPAIRDEARPEPVVVERSPEPSGKRRAPEPIEIRSEVPVRSGEESPRTDRAEPRRSAESARFGRAGSRRSAEPEYVGEESRRSAEAESARFGRGASRRSAEPEFAREEPSRSAEAESARPVESARFSHGESRRSAEAESPRPVEPARFGHEESRRSAEVGSARFDREPRQSAEAESARFSHGESRRSAEAASVREESRRSGEAESVRFGRGESRRSVEPEFAREESRRSAEAESARFGHGESRRSAEPEFAWDDAARSAEPEREPARFSRPESGEPERPSGSMSGAGKPKFSWAALAEERLRETAAERESAPRRAPALPLAPPPAAEPEEPARREPSTRHDAEHGSEAARSVLDRLGISGASGGGRRRADESHGEEEPSRPAAELAPSPRPEEGAPAPDYRDEVEPWLPRLRMPPSLEPMEDFGSWTPATAPFPESYARAIAEDEPPPDAGLADLLARALAEHQAGTASAAALVKQLGSHDTTSTRNGHGRNGHSADTRGAKD